MSDRYDAARAGRHLALGWYRPRAAMREAAGIGEPWRVVMVTISALIVILTDPAADGLPRLMAEQVADKATWGAVLGEFAPWGSLALAILLLVYAAIAGFLWLFTRPADAKPSFATLRSVVAVAGWISALPMVAAGLLADVAGLDWVGGLLVFGLWSAFAGLCLSEATGLDARAGAGLALGSGLLATLGATVVIVGLYVTLIQDDFESLLGKVTP